MKGTLTYGKRPRKGNPSQEIVRVDGFFPAILSEDEWNRLQQRLAIRRESSRGRTHSSEYLLSGIARCGTCGGAMVGKVGSMWRGKRYRNYYCSRAMRGRSLCLTYNGHSTTKLEQAILEYLGQFSDPELVRQHLDAAERQLVERKGSELKSLQKGLADLESRFAQHLDYLRKDLLNEEEFRKANEELRITRASLETRKQELARWVEEQQAKESVAERIPVAIGAFLEDFQRLEVRVQKAHLQTILKAAHVYPDGRIELEFRS